MMYPLFMYISLSSLCLCLCLSLLSLSLSLDLSLCLCLCLSKQGLVQGHHGMMDEHIVQLSGYASLYICVHVFIFYIYYISLCFALIK